MSRQLDPLRASFQTISLTLIIYLMLCPFRVVHILEALHLEIHKWNIFLLTLRQSISDYCLNNAYVLQQSSSLPDGMTPYSQKNFFHGSTVVVMYHAIYESAVRLVSKGSYWLTRHVLRIFKQSWIFACYQSDLLPNRWASYIFLNGIDYLQCMKV